MTKITKGGSLGHLLCWWEAGRRLFTGSKNFQKRFFVHRLQKIIFWKDFLFWAQVRNTSGQGWAKSWESFVQPLRSQPRSRLLHLHPHHCRPHLPPPHRHHLHQLLHLLQGEASPQPTLCSSSHSLQLLWRDSEGPGCAGCRLQGGACPSHLRHSFGSLPRWLYLYINCHSLTHLVVI